jgi:alpha-beta hydrolase superfamily lysophospholipase
MFGSNIRTVEYADKMCAESFWAYLQLMIPLLRIKKGIPMLVMGGTEDLLISVNEFKQTAKVYGAELMLMDGGSHDLMLDPDCARYADKIYAWMQLNP